MSPRQLVLPALVWLAACKQDASFTPLMDPLPSVEDTSAPPTSSDDSSVEPPPDPECPEPGVVSAAPATRNTECRNLEQRNALDAAEEWATNDSTFSHHPLHSRSQGAPVVGHLTDDEYPDIVGVFFAWAPGNCGKDSTEPFGVLRVVSGDGSGEHWSIKTLDEGGGSDSLGLLRAFSPALADVDADGEPEIVVGVWDGVSDRYIAALSAEGAVEWVSPSLGSGLVQLAEVYDIDQDGQPEVYADGHVLDGATGAVLWASAELPAGPSIVADLDGDGSQELINAAGVWNDDGTERCRHNLYDSRYGYDLAVADFEGDGEGEVVTAQMSATSGHISVTTAQCRLKAFSYQNVRSPTIADFDADGLPEIGISTLSPDEFMVLEADLSPIWQQNMATPSYDFVKTAASFDFEGDGFPEAIHMTRQIRLLSGTDGQPRYSDDGLLDCPMAYDHPVVVDIDNDDSAELVLLGNYGLRILGDRLNGWADAGEVWNQHSFSLTNINPDLTVPTYSAGNWPEYNTFRSGETRANRGQASGRVDLQSELVHRCEVECDRGMVQLTLRLANAGMADAGDVITAALYAESDAGARTLLHVLDFGTLVRSGYTTEGLTLQLDLEDLPDGRLVLVADDDGEGTSRIDECDEDNNVLVMMDLCGI
ncbi:MAG TPA: hypothetical protein DFR83_26260 [Deltaproteobacteria bacterium]|mgnify:CR=1 FL=1|nr:hypothetical protein [Deltaproteobacteria bacterium]